MAKTIGNNKGSATRARMGVGSGAVDERSSEARDEELLAGDDADATRDATDEISVDQEAQAVANRELATRVPSAGITRRPAVPQALMGNPVTRYLAESVIELRYNVTWPVPREAWNMTLIVIAMSAVVAAVLGVADIGLIRALNWVVSLGTSAPSR